MDHFYPKLLYGFYNFMMNKTTFSYFDDIFGPA